MNERIKELIIKAYARAAQMEQELFSQGASASDFFPEILAELIVKECLKIVEPDQTSGDEWCVTLDETTQSIRQHFGVEK